MKKADRVFRELGDLYDFYKKLSRFRIVEGREADGPRATRVKRCPRDTNGESPVRVKKQA